MSDPNTNHTNPPPKKSGGSSIALIVGGLVVAVVVLYWLFAGGGEVQNADVVGDETNISVESEAEGAAEVDLGGRPFTISQGFVEDLRTATLAPALADLGAALLVLHAPRDAIVGIDNASEIFRAAKHPKSFVTLDDADHLVTRAEDAEYAAAIIATWADRYLDLIPQAVHEADLTAEYTL